MGAPSDSLFGTTSGNRSITPFALFGRDGGSGGGDGDGVEGLLRKGEREKELENLLVKTKRDKDKAIRILVQIIGKDRISHFLNKHAGSPDILDKLLEYFANNVQLASSSPSHHHHHQQLSGSGGLDWEENSAHRSKAGGRSNASGSQPGGTKVIIARSPNQRTHGSPQRSPGKSRRGGTGQPQPPAMYRSRMDEYFRSTISGRDY